MTSRSLLHGTGIKLAAFTLMAFFAGFAITDNANGANRLLASGPNFFITESCAGCSVGPNGVGAVVVRYDIVDIPFSSQGAVVIATILDVLVFEEGWSYEIKKDGGENGTVEVVFENETCFVKFRSRVVPGKTKIDHGAVKCK